MMSERTQRILRIAAAAFVVIVWGILSAALAVARWDASHPEEFSDLRP